VRLTRSMQNTIVHDEGAVSLEAARTKIKVYGSIIKIGVEKPSFAVIENSLIKFQGGHAPVSG